MFGIERVGWLAGWEEILELGKPEKSIGCLLICFFKKEKEKEKEKKSLDLGAEISSAIAHGQWTYSPYFGRAVANREFWKSQEPPLPWLMCLLPASPASYIHTPVQEKLCRRREILDH